MKYFYIFLLYLPIVVLSQDTIPTIDGDILESLTERSDDVGTHDFHTLYENLELYLKNPLNINTASESDLQELHVFSPTQIVDIQNHREQYGRFLSVYELQSIPSLDMATLRAALPFVSTGSRTQAENIPTLLRSAQHTVYTKYKRILQKRRGDTRNYEQGGYRGSPDHYYVRYRMDAGQKLRAAFTIEKDAGELLYSEDKGLEYVSAYVYARNPTSYIDDIVVGDYSASMGQGLIMHNSFGGGKSSYVMNLRKSGRVLKPYGSINESNYLRGIGVSTSLGNFSTTLLASSKRIDGTAIRDTFVDTGFGRISSLNISGLHRTKSEYARKHNTRNNHWGLVARYKVRNFSLSANALYTDYDKHLAQSHRLYKRYAFSGSSLLNVSIDYSYRYRNVLLFGESAMSDNYGTAHVHGLLTGLGRYVDASVLYRHYDRDYQVLQANAFAESSLPINERGIYMGVKLSPYKRWTLSAYYDLWNHDWYRYQKDAPTRGKEYLVKLQYYQKRKLTAYLQYRLESKEESELLSEKTRSTTIRNQHRFRLHTAYKINTALEVRNRIEYAHTLTHTQASKGYMAYIDAIYKPIERPYSFTARYGVFDTDDFASRIYAYENDILYEFSIPFFSGNGSRFYINNRYKIRRWLTAELHYGITWYHNTANDPNYNGINSGNQHIGNNKMEEIKVQLKIKL